MDPSSCVTANSSGPVITVESEEFIAMIKMEHNVTIAHTPKRWYAHHRYVMNYRGFIVMTTSKEELRIPKHISVIKATAIAHYHVS